ncbi:MAG: VCBS repeat-containing protein [Planctomycetaceae bacterium]|nr:VCBS repeat-containing protein [Planctomycetaceae bacterium]
MTLWSESLEDRTLLAAALSVIDINTAGGDPVYGESAVVGSKLYYIDADTQHGLELHVLDTTTQSTSLVVDINPGLGDSIAVGYGGFMLVGNNLYFTAYDPTSGYELRWIDTTEATPAVNTLDIETGSGSSYAGQYGGFIAVGDKLYFTASDSSNGFELRWIDTTEAVPTLHTLDIAGGTTSSTAGQFGAFTAVGNNLYFTAYDSSSGEELRWIDTSEAIPVLHTVEVAAGSSRSYAGEYGGFTVVGNNLYFSATDSTRGFELRWIDTTETTPTVQTLDIFTGSNSSSAGRYGGFTSKGNNLYFSASDSTYGTELRWIDTTEATPTLHTVDVFSGNSGSNAGEHGGFTNVGDNLYFTARDSTSGIELRWIDTTETSPTLHTLDIASGAFGSNVGQYGGFLAVGNSLYFTALSFDSGYELRWIDTTETNPTLHTLDIYSGASSSNAGLYGGFAVVGDKLYFTAFDPSSGYELRWIDTTEPTPILVTFKIISGNKSSFPGEFGGFTVVGNKMYFTAITLSSILGRSYELCWIDTTEATPTLHTLDIYSGSRSSNPGQYSGLTVVGDKLYFTATDASSGYELRWIDAYPVASNLHVLDLYPGSDSSYAGVYGGLTVVGDKLYFTAQDSNGYELRWIDTTETIPTLHTLDIYSGSNSSSAGKYGGLKAVGDNLYFTAYDPFNGYELRWIDTTEPTPTLHTLDIWDGVPSSYAGQYGGFAAAGNHLYFSADKPGIGTELFVLELFPNTTPTISVGDLAYTEGDNSGNAVVIDSVATANDLDGDADWNGGSLTIQITANAEAADEISIVDIGNISVNRTTGEISSSGTHFATAAIATATVTGGTALTITFNSNTTNARVEELVRAVAYRTTSVNPTAGARTVRFTASDRVPLTGIDTATITVTAVNTPPSVTLTPVVNSLPENANTTPRIKVADISVVDDASGTYVLSLSGTDATLFEIDGTELFLVAGAALDFETKASLDVTVEVDDAAIGGSPDDSDSLSITITDVNELPTIALTPVVSTLPEDAATTPRVKVADILVSDDALGTNTLSLTGADASLFEINGTELFLIAGAILDFETNPVLDVTVEVDDAALGGTPDDSDSLSIDITDVNEFPSLFLTPVVTTLPEDATTTPHIKIADITVTDDGLGTNALSLSGDDAALFEIDGNELFLIAGTPLDFETNAALDVTVEVDDAAIGGAPDSSDSLSISITDVNELPTITLTPLVTSLLKDTSTASRIRVASVTVTDDALGTNVLSLTGDDSALFEIDGMDLYLKAGTVLDYSANPVLDVTVNVDDASLGGSPDDSDSLQVVITDRADLVLFDTATGLWRMGTSNGTSFTWTNGPKWNAAVGWTTFTGDYNGDGLTDGIGITSANKVFIARNNGDGTMTTVSAGSFSALETFQYMLVGDFNGDGRDDLIVQQATNNTTPLPGSWFVKSFNGSSFSTSFYGRWDASGWGDFGVGDVNQDGIDDIIGVRNAIEGVDRVNWMYGISNQIPDGSRRFFAQFAGAFTGRIETAGWHSVLIGDWDNDGRADVAARRNDGRFVYGTATGDPTPYAPIGANRLVNSTGPLFSNSAFSEPFLVGDFNGDGRDDILTRQTNNKNLWVAQTNATAPTSATVSGWGPWDDTLNWSGAAIGDFNGDGRDDYASIDLTGSHAWVSLSTGSTFQPAVDFGLVMGTESLVGPLKLDSGLLD